MLMLTWGQRLHVHCADARLQKARWAQDKGLPRILDHCRAADLLNRLLKVNAPPSNPDESLPHPTQAAWKSISAQMEMLLRVEAFFSDLDYTPPMSLLGPAHIHEAAAALQSLRQDLLELPYNLVGGYLPDLTLDVMDLMR